jgi:hypothetical protein
MKAIHRIEFVAEALLQKNIAIRDIEYRSRHLERLNDHPSLMHA